MPGHIYCIGEALIDFVCTDSLGCATENSLKKMLEEHQPMLAALSQN